jgi:hypothetical protein
MGYSIAVNISITRVGNTASVLCAFLEHMYYCIETLSELDGENSEQYCSFL